MDRVVKISVACGFFCDLILAVDGYLPGAGANGQQPPGREGAFINAMIWVVFYDPVVWAFGVAGGL